MRSSRAAVSPRPWIERVSAASPDISHSDAEECRGDCHCTLSYETNADAIEMDQMRPSKNDRFPIVRLCVPWAASMSVVGWTRDGAQMRRA